MVRFPFRIVQEIELNPATACRFHRDTGFDTRHGDRVAWCCRLEAEELKVETSDLYVGVTHRILT